MLIFNTNLCYLCSQLLVSHRSISFFLFPIIRIHFPLCNRFWPVYSFFPFCFEKFNKLQLKFTNWNYLFFSYCTFETYIIQWGIKIADCYCSLVVFREVFLWTKFTEKTRNAARNRIKHDFCVSRRISLWMCGIVTTLL